MKFIIIYITHKNLKEAKKIADHLLRKKLARGDTFRGFGGLIASGG